MTQVAATPSVWTNWTWPEEVRAFAVEHQADVYLEPLEEALARLFPAATEAEAVVSLRDGGNIALRIGAHWDEPAEYLAMTEAWCAELSRIVPAPRLWVFRLSLQPGDR